MNTRLFSLAASLVLSISGGAMAQAAANPDANQATAPALASSIVGRWIYDSQGQIIGSVRSLTDDGRTAVVMVGSYLQQGSHEARISSSMLSVIGGKVTLQPGTAEALNIASRR